MLKYRVSIIVAAFIELALAILAVKYSEDFAIIFVIFALLIIAYTIYGTFRIGSGIYIKSICSFDSDLNNIYLTFDDGPNPVITPKVLDILKQFGVRAAFFCVGSKAVKYPEILKRIYNEGHTLGNHSYSHSGLIGFQKSGSLLSEIRRTNEAIYNIIGKKPLLYRPPFGVTNPSVARAVKKAGMKVIGWSVRTFDAGNAGHDKILQKLKKIIKPGSIILLHDKNEKIIPVLTEFLLYGKSMGFRFQSLESALGEIYDK